MLRLLATETHARSRDLLDQDYDETSPEHQFALEEACQRILPARMDILDILNTSEFDSDLAWPSVDDPHGSRPVTAEQGNNTSRPTTANRMFEQATSGHYSALGLETTFTADQVNDPRAAPYKDNVPFNPTAKDRFLTLFGLLVDTIQLSRRHYAMLAELLRSFSTSEDTTEFIAALQALPKSMETLQRYRRHLPLGSLYSKDITLDTSKLPSNTSPEGKLHFFNIIDIARLTLNSTAFSQMYFGPAILTHEVSELYHGTNWAQGIRSTSGILPRYYHDSSCAVLPGDGILYYVDQVNPLTQQLVRITRHGRIRYIWDNQRAEKNATTLPSSQSGLSEGIITILLSLTTNTRTTVQLASAGRTISILCGTPCVTTVFGS